MILMEIKLLKLYAKRIAKNKAKRVKNRKRNQEKKVINYMLNGKDKMIR